MVFFGSIADGDKEAVLSSFVEFAQSLGQCAVPEQEKKLYSGGGGMVEERHLEKFKDDGCCVLTMRTVQKARKFLEKLRKLRKGRVVGWL